MREIYNQIAINLQAENDEAQEVVEEIQEILNQWETATTDSRYYHALYLRPSTKDANHWYIETDYSGVVYHEGDEDPTTSEDTNTTGLWKKLPVSELIELKKTIVEKIIEFSQSKR